jgi:RNA polymerase sigma-70 factor (ECF subfamily)
VATRQDEFERTALPHSRSLLRVARRLSSNTVEAEDLVQETLLLAWRNFRQFRAGTNARAWLFRILFNSFYAQGRRQRAAPLMVSFSSAETRNWPEQSAAAFSGLDSADLGRALASLHVDHRTVLLLGIVEGFTCREMADILSLPIGTVMSRLSRARLALRAQLVPSAKCAGKDAS